MRKNKCSLCGYENFILDYKCSNCKTIIREKISTINLGETLKNLLLNLEFGIKQVLFAEHKNYLIILSIFLSIKLTLITLFKISFIDIHRSHQTIIVISLLFWLGFIYTLAFFSKLLLRLMFHIKIFYKDMLTIIVFPFIYFSLSLVLIFPIELMLFGKYLFSNNPSIFTINFGKALSVSFIEIVIFLYSVYLIFNFLVFILRLKINAMFLTTLNIILLFLGNEVLKKIIGIN